MTVSRTPLFSRALGIALRSGPMWLVALAAAAVNLLGGLLLDRFDPSGSTLGSVLSTLLFALTTAFLTGALIVLADRAAEGQFPSFADGFAAGVRFYPVLLLVDLLMAPPLFAADQAQSAIFSQLPQDPTAALQLPDSTMLLALCGLPILFLVFLLVIATLVGAERAAALEGAGAGAALRRGWRLLATRMGDMFVIGLMELGVMFVAGLLFGCCGFLALTINPSLANAGSSGAPGFLSGITFSILLDLVMVPFQVWFSTVWTLAFRRWQGKDLPVVVAE